MGIDKTIVFRRHLQRGKQVRGHSFFLFGCKCVQVWRGVSWFVREKPYNQARCVHYGPPTDAHTKATQQPPVRTDQALSRGPLLSIDSLGEKGGTFVAVRSRARRPLQAITGVCTYNRRLTDEARARFTRASRRA